MNFDEMNDWLDFLYIIIGVDEIITNYDFNVKLLNKQTLSGYA